MLGSRDVNSAPKPALVPNLKSAMALEAALAESEQLNRQNMSQIGEEFNQFTVGLVHDLRSAQRGLAVSAELLQNLLGASLSPDAHAILTNLVESATKSNEVLAAATHYAMALGTGGYSWRRVKVSSVVRDAIATMEREIRESDANITYGELPEVRADRDRLLELFRRLIDNSIKYRGSAPPRIEIEAQRLPVRQSQHELAFQFSVHDHGIGIDQKFRSELFRPFRRLHGPEIPGVGLSLVICRKIVEAHGGTLWIESDAGKGVTVFFTLPATA